MINIAGDEMVPVELKHIERAQAKLGTKATYVLIREVAAYGHFAVAQTIDVYAPKIGDFLRRLQIMGADRASGRER